MEKTNLRTEMIKYIVKVGERERDYDAYHIGLLIKSLNNSNSYRKPRLGLIISQLYSAVLGNTIDNTKLRADIQKEARRIRQKKERV